MPGITRHPGGNCSDALRTPRAPVSVASFVWIQWGPLQQLQDRNSPRWESRTCARALFAVIFHVSCMAALLGGRLISSALCAPVFGSPLRGQQLRVCSKLVESPQRKGRLIWALCFWAQPAPGLLGFASALLCPPHWAPTSEAAAILREPVAYYC